MTDNVNDQFSATESFLGQTYQIWYALHLLLQAGHEEANSSISVELIDDVAVHQGTKITNATQTKRTKTDLSDFSVPVWKTLRIWSEHLTNGVIDTKHTVLTLVSTSTAPANSAASMLRPLNAQKPNDRNEVNALKLLTEVARKSTNKNLAPAFKAFLALNDDQRKALIGQITVLDGHSDIAQVKENINKQLGLAAPPGKENVFYESVGQRWRGMVDLALEKSLVISYTQLRFVIQDILGQLQATNLPIDFRDTVPGVLPPLNTDRRRFVRQLNLLQIGDARIDSARIDYLKAATQRSSWARRKLLGIDELPKYEKTVKEEWKRRFDANCENLDAKSTEPQKLNVGKEIYRWAELDAVNMPMLRIRENCGEHYVLRGTFHLLADHDADGIGWHPEYEKLLADAKKGNAA